MPSSRRRLFQMAGLAAPSLWLGKRASALAPADQLGVLAVGVRNRGAGVALAAARFGAVNAVCDVDSECADGFLVKLAQLQQAKPEIYKDYRKALERKDVNIVTIGTPDHWHTAILLAALRAGKHVYCEKPMTLTIDEGIRICRAVEQTGLTVQVGTQQRSEYDQMFLKAVALARAGRLGKKLTATCAIGKTGSGGPFQPETPPAALDWDFWLGQAPETSYIKQRCHATFRSWFEYSGGKMTDWGAHHVDIAQWAIGAEDTGPVEIEGEGELPIGREATLELMHKGHAPGDKRLRYNTAVNFRVTLRFANGNTVIVRDGEDNRILLEGERGSIEVSRKQLKGALIEEIAADSNESARLNEAVIQLCKGRQPGRHMDNFIQSLWYKTQPVSDVFTHHRTLSSCHLANIALILGRKLRWDPARQEFPGDEEANSLVSRKQRKGYRLES